MGGVSLSTIETTEFLVIIIDENFLVFLFRNITSVLNINQITNLYHVSVASRYGFPFWGNLSKSLLKKSYSQIHYESGQKPFLHNNIQKNILTPACFYMPVHVFLTNENFFTFRIHIPLTAIIQYYRHCFGYIMYMKNFEL